MFTSVHRRLVAWNVLVFAIVLTVVVGFGSFTLSMSFNNAVQAELEARLAQQETIVSRLGIKQLASQDAARLQYDLAFPAVFAIVTDSRGRVLTAPAGLRALALPDRRSLQEGLAGHMDERTVNRNGRHVLLLSGPVRAGGRVVGAIQVGRSLALHERELNLLTTIAFIGGGVGLILALGGSFLLAQRALNPVRQAFAAQRAFVADASHELRTPLAIVRGTAEMLQQRYGKNPQRDRERIDDVIVECDQLKRLVDDLLTLARSDVNQLAIVPEVIDLGPLLNDACRRAAVLADQRERNLTWTTGQRAMVRGDPNWITQLTSILLENALSYTDRGGHIHVLLEVEPSDAVVRVSDTGIGIPPDALPFIFDRFYRVDPARNHTSGGTGLGLAMARTITTLHGGHISVQSQVGKGSTFTVRLPLLLNGTGAATSPISESTEC
jgi:two-component system sensor histidine kinase CiaH